MGFQWKSLATVKFPAGMHGDTFTIKAPHQRAANGGSDPSWLNLAFSGRPDFQSRGPQIPIFKGFWDLWTEDRGAPKTPNSTMTDLTTHLRPSEPQECSKKFASTLRGKLLTRGQVLIRRFVMFLEDVSARL